MALALTSMSYVTWGKLYDLLGIKSFSLSIFFLNHPPKYYKVSNELPSHFPSEVSRNKGPLFMQKYLPLPALIRV